VHGPGKYQYVRDTDFDDRRKIHSQSTKISRGKVPVMKKKEFAMKVRNTAV
jgi:hypothetical protein